MNQSIAKFDQTGVVGQALCRIYSVADSLMEMWAAYPGGDCSPGDAEPMIKAARERAAGMLDLGIRMHAYLQRYAEEHPEMAPNVSALVALDSLSKFATDLVLAYDQNPEDAPESIKDVAFEMLIHDHAKAMSEV